MPSNRGPVIPQILPLYRVDRQGRFVPTESTGSPWRHGFQHGGPPCGLLAHLAENAEREHDGPNRVPVRTTVELFRPVPQEPLVGTVERLRAGRRLAVWRAALSTEDGTTVCQANVLFLAPGAEGAREPLQAEPSPPEFDPELDPVPMVPAELADRVPPGFHFRVDVRWQQHEGIHGAWIDMPMPLVESRKTSAFVRAAALADFANAVNGRARAATPAEIAPTSTGANPRPPFSFINCDSTLLIERLPDDGPLYLRTEQFVAAGGIGTCRVALFDRDGRCGTIYQASLQQRTGPTGANASGSRE